MDVACDGVTGEEAARGIAAVRGWLPALVRAVRRGQMVDDALAQQAAAVLAAALQTASEEEVARALASEPGAVPATAALLRDSGPEGRAWAAQSLAAFILKRQEDAVVDTPGALLALIRAATSSRVDAAAAGYLLNGVYLACIERPSAVQALAADASLIPLAAGTLLNPSGRGGADGGATVSFGADSVPIEVAFRVTAGMLLWAIASGGEALASRVVAQPGVFDGLLRLVPSKWESLSLQAGITTTAIMARNAEVARRAADAATPDALRGLVEGLGSADQSVAARCAEKIRDLLRHCSTGGGVPTRIADAALPALAAAVCAGAHDDPTHACLSAIQTLLEKDETDRKRVAQQPGLLRAIVAMLDRASSGDGGSGDSSSNTLALTATMALFDISMDDEAARLLAATEGAAEALAAAVRGLEDIASNVARLAVLYIAPHAALAALLAVLPVLTDWMEGTVGNSTFSKSLHALEAIQASEPAAAEAVAREPGLLHHVVRLSSASAAFEGSRDTGGSSGGGGGGDPLPLLQRAPRLRRAVEAGAGRTLRRPTAEPLLIQCGRGSGGRSGPGHGGRLCCVAAGVPRGPRRAAAAGWRAAAAAASCCGGRVVPCGAGRRGPARALRCARGARDGCSRRGVRGAPRRVIGLWYGDGRASAVPRLQRGDARAVLQRGLPARRLGAAQALLQGGIFTGASCQLLSRPQGPSPAGNSSYTRR
jgi:hypothetical protein